MKSYNRLAAVMCVNIFSMHCATSSANEEDISLHALLSIERLENIMDRQPAAHSGPSVRLPSGRILTANGPHEAIQPLIQSQPADPASLVDALSGLREEVRWGACLAIEGITSENVRFHRASKAGSSIHLEAVNKWTASVIA